MNLLGSFYNYWMGDGNSEQKNDSTNTQEKTTKNHTENSYLEKLTKTESFEERQEILNGYAEKFLSEEYDFPLINLSQFAQMHISLKTFESKLEGCNPLDSVHYWISLFKQWREKKCHFIKLGIDEKEMDKVISALKDYEEMGDLIDLYPKVTQFHDGKSLNNDEKILYTAKLMQAKIKQSLEEKGYIYAYQGYCSGNNNQGHSITCKYVLKNNKILVFMLNKGEGSGYHPQLELKETHFKSSMRYFEIKIAPEVLFGERGLSSFCRDLRLRSERPDANATPYDSKDIYRRMQMLGEVNMNFSENMLKWAVKTQLGPKCAEEGVEMIVRDVLIEDDVDKKNQQRIFCNGKFCSIIAVYQQYKNRIGERLIFDVLDGAIKEFTVDLDKFYEDDVIHADEKLLFKAVVDVINSHLAKQTFSSPLKMVELKSDNLKTEFPLLKLGTDYLKYNKNKEEIGKKEHYFIIPTLPYFNIDEAVSLLGEWENAIDEILLTESNPVYISSMMTYLFNQLPVPKSDGKDVWSTLSEKDIPPCLKHLTSILYKVQEASQTVAHPNLKMDLFLAVHTAYAIADRLMRRSDPYMEGFFSPYWFNLHLNERDEKRTEKQRIREKIFLIPNGLEMKRYGEIIDYFSGLKKKHEKALFYFSDSIDMEKGVRSLEERYFSNTNFLACRLKYLNQFYSEAFSISGNTKENYALLWADKESKFLPKGHQELQFISFLASNWSLLGNYSRQIPKYPSPLYSIDENSKENWVLKIDLNEKSSLQVPSYFTLRSTGDESFVTKIFDYHRFNRQVLDRHIDAILPNLLTPHRLSVNQAILYHLHYNTDSEVQQLLRLTCEPSLQIVLVTQWIASHSYLLSQGDLWSGIQLLYFTPGLLQKTLSNSPELVEEIRSTMSKALDYYKDNLKEVETHIFLLYLSYCLETHFKEFQQEKYDFSTLNQYLKIVLTLPDKENKFTNSRVYFLIFCLYNALDTLDVDGVCHLLDVRSNFDLFTNDDAFDSYYLTSSLSREGHQSYLLNEFNFAKIIQESQAENKICQLIVKKRFPKISSDFEGDWKGEYPIFKNGEYELNLNTMTMKHKGSLFVDNMRDIVSLTGGSWSSSERDLLRSCSWWQEGNKFHSNDGSMLIDMDKKSLYKKIAPQKKENWFRLIPDITIMNHSHSSQITLNLLFRSHASFFLWKSEADNEDRHYYITEVETGHLFYYVKESDKEMEIIKTNSIGGLTQIKLIDPFALKSIHPEFYQLMMRFGQNFQSWCFYDFELERIDSLHFVLGSFNFYGKMRENKWVFESKEHPTYFLSNEQTIEELNFFDGCLMIENEWGEKKIIILDKMPSQQEGELVTSRLSFGSNQIKYSENQGSRSIPSFIFTLDSQKRRLKNSDAYANGFLMMLFCLQRDYEKAMHYLPYSRSFSSYDTCEWTKLFYPTDQLKDRSAEAIAFYLQLALHFFDNLGQEFDPEKIRGQESDNKKNRDQEFDTFVIWVSHRYIDYLNAMHSDTINRIPGYIRLSRPEEKKLNTFLRTQLQDGEYWFNIQEVRFRLLTNPKSINTEIKEKSFQIFYSPNIMFTVGVKEFFIISSEDAKEIIDHIDSSSLKDLSVGFVRVNPQHFSMKKLFIQLYQKAISKESKDLDFDLLYLDRSFESKKNNEIEANREISILWTVQRHPDQFEKLQFSEELSFEENKKTLLEIYLRARGLQGVGKLMDFKLMNSFNFGEYRTFKYSKKFSLKLKGLDPIKKINWQSPVLNTKSPLKKLTESFFDSKFLLKPFMRHSQKFMLGDSRYQPANPIEKKILDGIKEGHLINSELKCPFYEFKESVTKEPLMEELKNFIDKESLRLSELKIKIEDVANSYPFNKSTKIDKDQIIKDTLLDLRKTGGQVEKITMDNQIVQALLEKDSSIIFKDNPSLSEKELHQIISDASQYLIGTCYLYQAKTALSRCKQGSADEIGSLLDWEGDSDFIKYPEILVYAYCTQRLPWQVQLKILKLIFSAPLKQGALNKLLFAFQAGGGKTSLLMILLMAKARREGWLPIAVGPSFLDSIDSERLKYPFLQAFRQKLCKLTVDLAKPFSDEAALWLLNLLKSYVNEKQHIKTTPESCYAIDLHYKLALYSGSENIVGALSQCKKIMSEQGFSFIDESKLTLNPLTQSKIGVGKGGSLPRSVQDLFIEVYKVLIGQIKNPLKLSDGTTLAKAIDLQHNEQAKLSESDWSEAKILLADYFLDYAPLKINENQREKFKKYWLDFTLPRPLFIDNYDSEAAQLIFWLRGILNVILPTTLKMVGEMEYGTSSKDKDIFIPKNRRQSTTAIFEKAAITTSITIQGALQRGLSYNQVKEMVCYLQKLHFQESKDKKEQSEYRILFKKWMDSDFFADLENINSYDDIQSVKKKLSHHSEAIIWYLRELVIPKITYSPQELCSTPAHLINSFKYVNFFSAYPSLAELYAFHPGSRKKEFYIEDLPFIAAAVHQACAKVNSRMISVSTKLPLQFFRELAEKDLELLVSVRTVIDVDGMLCDTSNRGVASAYFQVCKENSIEIDGILLFDDESPTDKLLFWPTKGESQSIAGSDIKGELAELGYQWDKMKIVTLFDPTRTIAGDIVQEKNAIALILIGGSLTMGDLVQGLFRLRLFLESQSVVWCGLESFFEKIKRDFDITSIDIQDIIWMSLKNEASKAGQEIVLRAYQEIQFLIQNLVDKELLDAVEDPKKQIKIFKKYEKGLLNDHDNNPKLLYGHASTLEDAKEVLELFAQNYYNKFGFQTEWSNAKGIQEQVSDVINEVVALIKKIPSKPIHNLLQQSHTHTHQIQHEIVKEQQISIHNTPLEPLVEKNLPEECSIFSEDFMIHLSEWAQPAQKMFNCDEICSDLYYTQNTLVTAAQKLVLTDLISYHSGFMKSSKQEDISKPYLKPIDCLLVYKSVKNKNPRVFAVTNKEAAVFQEQMLSKKNWDKSVKIEHQVLLMTSEGMILQNGPDILGWNHEEIINLKKTDWLKDIIIDVGLLNGRIYLPEETPSRLERWKGFGNFWETIKRLNVNPNEMNRHAIEKLMKEN